MKVSVVRSETLVVDVAKTGVEVPPSRLSCSFIGLVVTTDGGAAEIGWSWWILCRIRSCMGYHI